MEMNRFELLLFPDGELNVLEDILTEAPDQDDELYNPETERDVSDKKGTSEMDPDVPDYGCLSGNIMNVLNQKLTLTNKTDNKCVTSTSHTLDTAIDMSTTDNTDLGTTDTTSVILRPTNIIMVM